MMGNVVVWKPASYAMLSNYFVMQILEEAGLPPGVINFIPGEPGMITDTLMAHREFAGIHYTGSTAIFNGIYKKIAQHIDNYKSYPRVVGETGGKDFIAVHPTAQVAAVATAMIRGGFEYAGQKCSAASRTYIPQSMWPALKAELLSQMSQVKMGSPEDPTVLVNAVIHKGAFERCKSYIDFAKSSPDCEIIHGGKCDNSVGYFVEPTLVVVKDAKNKLMCEEIFGPILTIHVYDDAPANSWESILKTVNETSPYALTGSVFARDRTAIVVAEKLLEDSAGNFYINDKPTGAVVGRQPFGGARGSGTNDKAGSHLNLLRWTSARTIKETFVPPTHFSYPYMKE
jgi:1-pyrroline-5-carboxylate dehydrogenase